MRPTAASLACCLILCACSTEVGTLHRESPTVSEGEAVLILGVTPGDYRVVMSSGSVSGGRFEESAGRRAVVAGTPRNGYLVARAKRGEILAIMVVAKPPSMAEGAGQVFFACDDAKTMVFRVPNARAGYLGSVDYAVAERQMTATHSQDIEGARNFAAIELQLDAQELQGVPFELMPTTLSCKTTPAARSVPLFYRRR